MIVTYTLDDNAPLTKEQIEEIRQAAKMPITYDEDCPEMTDEMLRKFRRVNPKPDTKRA